MRRVVLVQSFIFMTLLIGCKKEIPVEEQIKREIETIVDFANKRQIGKIMDFISSDYRDTYGNHKDSIKAMLIQNLLFRKNVRIILKDIAVEVSGERAVVRAGIFVKEGEGIIPENADIIRIELQMINIKDRWLVTSALWRSGASPF